jgi:hypothetical protein
MTNNRQQQQQQQQQQSKSKTLVALHANAGKNNLTEISSPSPSWNLFSKLM